jgi:hypothetical protein
MAASLCPKWVESGHYGNGRNGWKADIPPAPICTLKLKTKASESPVHPLISNVVAYDQLVADNPNRETVTSAADKI